VTTVNLDGGWTSSHEALYTATHIMDRSSLLLAAAVIFWLHMAVIAFNVFGLVVIPLGAWRGWGFVRVFWWRALHLAALIVVALQAVLGRACFLTIWESELLARAGAAGSSAPLIQAWITRLVFWPLPLWFFALLYVAIGVYALSLWWLVPVDRRGSADLLRRSR
jgi:hypothetical protein